MEESLENAIASMEISSSDEKKMFIIRELRKSKSIRQDLILKYGPDLLRKVNEIEYWNLTEQIYLAAIDTGNFDIAQIYLQKIKQKFPKSARLGRLIGISLESQGLTSQAVQLYDEFLKDHPTNLLLMKRKVSVYLSSGNIIKATDELQSILKQFPFEISCWIELASIYLKNNELESALHCYEEAILLESTNPHYHCRLAEIYYALGNNTRLRSIRIKIFLIFIGGYDNVLLARKHYSISVSMLASKVNLRALHGLIYCCQCIASDDNTSSRKKLE